MWSGIPWKIDVDAVVNSTSETFETSEIFRGETIHVAAGPLLGKACRQIKSCRTSQACVTDAFNLPVKKIIHTVGPRYAVKYHTAAENALCHCIWSCLEALVEENLRSIAMGCIYTHAKGFPRDVGAHVTARTIRRYLEKHRETVDAVVLCIPEAQDLDRYEQVLPLYFPRTKEEEQWALKRIPENVGNERGESLMIHRDIRIGEMPQATFGGSRGSTEPPSSSSSAAAKAVVKGEKPREKTEIKSWSGSGFTQMVDSPDSKRGGDDDEMSWKISDIFGGFFSSMGIGSSVGASSKKEPSAAAEAEDPSSIQGYSDLMMKRALIHKTDDIHMMRMLSKTLDADGDPVVVITGVHFLVKAVDPERFVLYFVKESESLCSGMYSIVLIDTDTSPNNWPGFSFIRQVHSALGENHRKNLKAFYALHASFRLRSAAFFLQLSEPYVWGKLKYLENLQELYAIVPKKNIRIPEHVLQYESTPGNEEKDEPVSKRDIKSNEAFL